MSKYQCLNQQVFEEGAFCIKPVNKADIEMIRIWRNEQLTVLRQNSLISQEQQINYFNTVIFPLFEKQQPNQLLFSYFKNNILIGYGGLVHINWQDKRAEISFLLKTIYVADIALHDSYFNIYLQLIQKVGFGNLGFHKLHAEIYDNRPHHIAVMVKNGFQIEGRLRSHVLIDNIYKDSVICGKLIAEY